MISVKALINKARLVLKDKDDNNNSYKDEELLLYLNSGLRFLKRIILHENPLFITDYFIQTETDDNIINLETTVSMVTSVEVDGKRLDEINYYEITNHDSVGNVKYYYIVNNNRTVVLYPKPNKKINVRVLAVSDEADLTMENNTSCLNAFDELVLEYMCIRAGIGDRFDESQEMSIMGYIVSQITNIVYPKNTMLNYVEGDTDD